MDAFLTGVESNAGGQAARSRLWFISRTPGPTSNHRHAIPVEIMAAHGGDDPGTLHRKLNKTTQRAVSVELADNESEDGDIARSVKPGFMWRERMSGPRTW